MKNEDSPLIKALRSRRSSEPASPTFESPNLFKVNHEDIPGLAGHKVGEKISVNLKGHVHSQHAEGHAMVAVEDVKPDSSDIQDKEYPDKENPSKGGDATN